MRTPSLVGNYQRYFQRDCHVKDGTLGSPRLMRRAAAVVQSDCLPAGSSVTSPGWKWAPIFQRVPDGKDRQSLLSHIPPVRRDEKLRFLHDIFQKPRLVAATELSRLPMRNYLLLATVIPQAHWWMIQFGWSCHGSQSEPRPPILPKGNSDRASESKQWAKPVALKESSSSQTLPRSTAYRGSGQRSGPFALYRPAWDCHGWWSPSIYLPQPSGINAGLMH